MVARETLAVELAVVEGTVPDGGVAGVDVRLAVPDAGGAVPDAGGAVPDAGGEATP